MSIAKRRSFDSLRCATVAQDDSICEMKFRLGELDIISVLAYEVIVHYFASVRPWRAIHLSAGEESGIVSEVP